MFKLFKYIRKSWPSVLVIIALLLVQAVCDLTLPEYTSKIVNVGIQQKGIENAVPDVISKQDMDKLTLFMTKEDKEKVLDNYESLDKASEATKMDLTGNEAVYQLDTEDKDTVDDLNEIFTKPMVIVSMISSDNEQTKEMEEQILANMPPQAVKAADGDLFKIFAMMPEKQLDTIKDQISSKFDEMPGTILDQAAISYVKTEYSALGVDIDNLQIHYIFVTGAKMIGIALLSMAAAVLVGFIASRVGSGISRDLRSRLFNKVMDFSNEEMEKFSTASLITRSTNDIQQIQMVTILILKIILYAPILAIGGVYKVFQTNTSMSWIIALAVVVIIVVISGLFMIVMPKFKKVQKLVDRLNLVTREIVTGIPVIRAFSTEKYEEKRFDVANDDLTRLNLFVNRVMSGMLPVMMLIMNGVTALVIWNGAKSIDVGEMQVGDMMAFMQYAMQIIISFLMMSMLSIILPRASVSAGRVDEVLETTVKLRDIENPEHFDENKKGYVEFKNVSFKYPDADEDVLTDINFVAKPGETTAFIGSTGSGKSTLINLIPRFYDATEGEVLVDGVDVKKVSQHELRDKLGYVPQKGVLFSGTIESNLMYGKPDALIEEVEQAAGIAQATEFISAKPEGFKAPIAQGGTNVSGGQKQRLSIARAIAKRPEIYIFDDSFSALDYKTDSQLRKALQRETGESTVLIVAQRISTIMHAEQIIVLDEGKVVGKGTHKELLKNCEVYREIAQSQLSKEELENE